MCQFPSLTPGEVIGSVASGRAEPSLPPGWPLGLMVIRHEVSPCPNKPSNVGPDNILTHAITVTALVMLNGVPEISTCPDVPSNTAEAEPPKNAFVGPA